MVPGVASRGESGDAVQEEHNLGRQRDPSSTLPRTEHRTYCSTNYAGAGPGPQGHTAAAPEVEDTCRAGFRRRRSFVSVGVKSKPDLPFLVPGAALCAGRSPHLTSSVVQRCSAAAPWPTAGRPTSLDRVQSARLWGWRGSRAAPNYRDIRPGQTRRRDDLCHPACQQLPGSPDARGGDGDAERSDHHTRNVAIVASPAQVEPAGFCKEEERARRGPDYLVNARRATALSTTAGILRPATQSQSNGYRPPAGILLFLPGVWIGTGKRRGQKPAYEKAKKTAKKGSQRGSG